MPAVLASSASSHSAIPTPWFDYRCLQVARLSGHSAIAENDGLHAEAMALAELLLTVSASNQQLMQRLQLLQSPQRMLVGGSSSPP